MQTSGLEGVDKDSDPLHQTVPQLDRPQHPSSRALALQLATGRRESYFPYRRLTTVA
jgi:hypothetical protein